ARSVSPSTAVNETNDSAAAACARARTGADNGNMVAAPIPSPIRCSASRGEIGCMLCSPVWACLVILGFTHKIRVTDPLRSRLRRRSRCPPHEGDSDASRINRAYSPPREGESRRRRQGVAHTVFMCKAVILAKLYRYSKAPISQFPLFVDGRE